MPWVAGHLTGGLGNRLFQHAAALGLAEKWGYAPVFYVPKMKPTNHGPFDNIFRLFPTIPKLQDDESFVLLSEPQGNVFTYTSFQASPLGSNALIDGWRQSERYFPSQGVQVALEESLSLERKRFLLEKYNVLFKEQELCFLHIRLGDYKVLPHHQINIGSYVVDASKHFSKENRFLVFSDEAVENKKMLEEFMKTLGFSCQVVEETDELENLYLMSQCWGGAIVANSTFSWWGAYFARQRCPSPTSYKACYPSVWGAGLPPARDVVPAWGIRIANQ